MHIKHIHDMIEKLSECAKCEMDKGLESMDAKELGEVSEIIKELAEAEYYAKISKAMDEAEYGEDYDYMGAYDEQSRKGYRGQRRDSRGRYMSNRGRRGYEEAMYYTMTPEMYREHDPEYYRDMDREQMGRMYYSGGSGSSGVGSSNGMSGGSSGGSSYGMSGGSMGSQGGQSSGGSSGGSRGYSESRYENAKRGYKETKEMHKSGSSEDKQITMKEGEKMLNVILDEIEEMLEDAPVEMKSMVKSKVMTKMQKI